MDTGQGTDMDTGTDMSSSESDGHRLQIGHDA